jgi:hypothetical protein
VQKGRLIIVAGMHRAGTSTITGVLEALGVKLGKFLAAAQPEINAKGYKEDVEVIDIHEDLLWSMPSAWDSILPISNNDISLEALSNAERRIENILVGYFRKNAICAVKDPRICLFLPLWINACQRLDIEPTIIIAIRYPSSVALSLCKRDGMNRNRAKLLWIKYFLQAEKKSRDISRYFLSYEQLLSQPDYVINHLISSVGMSIPPEHLVKARNFIDPALNRSHTVPCEQPTGDWIEEGSIRLYNAMNDSNYASEADLFLQFENVEKTYNEFIKNLDPILLDQSNNNIAHAAEFRRYWNDALTSRPLKLIHAFRKFLPKHNGYKKWE